MGEWEDGRRKEGMGRWVDVSLDVK